MAKNGNTESRPQREVLNSVVKVLAVTDAPNYEQPWQTHGTESSTGSGAIVETSRGLRVLTNAHVIQNQVFVEVRRYGRARRFVAEVEGVGHECDLALLSVDDEEFFKGTKPIALGALPQLADTVAVLGFPIGGDRLSISKGIVSRIEMTRYAQVQRRLLAVQIDAAINSGNSGGPVIKDGALAGVAFQSLDDAENTGYMVAPSVVEHFLRDMDNGAFDGFPHLGITFQSLESKALRAALGLQDRGGVLVTNVAYESSAWPKLRKKDVLLAIDGQRVASDGTVRFRKSARIDFSYLVARRHVGEKLPVEISRNGRAKKLELVLKPRQYLVPEDRYDVAPTYYVYGGLLFVPLTRDYLKTWHEDWWSTAPRHLMALYEDGIRTEKRREVVVLQKVLADRVNRGYHDIESLVIDRVEGAPIVGMRELVERVEAARGTTVTLDAEDGSMIVLDRADVSERHDAILRRYRVPEDRSADLRP